MVAHSCRESVPGPSKVWPSLPLPASTVIHSHTRTVTHSHGDTPRECCSAKTSLAQSTPCCLYTVRQDLAIEFWLTIYFPPSTRHLKSCMLGVLCPKPSAPLPARTTHSCSGSQLYATKVNNRKVRAQT